MSRFTPEEFPQHLTAARLEGETARGRLLDSYSGYLTLLARSQVGRKLQAKIDAGDLVQETFLEAHRQFAIFRGTTEAELVAWLHRILAGTIAGQMRRYLGTRGRDLRMEQALITQLDESSQCMNMGIADSGSTPSQHVSRREQALLLVEALDRLPADYREVIMLRNVEGLSFAEVAARMSRSEDSVQKLWVRGLASLQRSVGEKV
jgi:RNA polymerase sigma-70 factor (ECF subfamily)